MALERDEFFIGERVNFDTQVKLANGNPPADLAGTTPLLTIEPPPDDQGTARTEVTPAVTIAGTFLHAEYVTVYAGWHEWRWETSGVIESAEQGRFRVLPKNV
jgi:hypothetical protein